METLQNDAEELNGAGGGQPEKLPDHLSTCRGVNTRDGSE